VAAGRDIGDALYLAQTGDRKYRQHIELEVGVRKAGWGQVCLAPNPIMRRPSVRMMVAVDLPPT
jgi:hypothetical protein